MKRVVGVCVLGAIVGAAGCGSPPQQESPDPARLSPAPPTAAPSPSNAPTGSTSAAPVSLPPEKNVVAEVSGQPITLDELIKPLVESHGLPLLLNIAELDLAKQDTQTAHLTVTPEDLKTEQDLTLEKMFPDQNERDRKAALEQYLQGRNVGRLEYDKAIELTAYLRKAAITQLKGQITDDMVEKQFGIEYGETAKCRYIMLGNMQEVQQAQARLKAGEDFAAVATAMSRDPRTAPLGGELPPFSLQTVGYPEQFRQLAFSLQPGQVSDALALDKNWYLIKLERKFPPKAVKFQNVKESLRQSMYDRFAEMLIRKLRDGLKDRALAGLKIHDPMLAKQLDTLKSRSEGAIPGNDRDKLAEQWRREREAATQPSSQPASDLSGPPAPAPATSEPTSTTAPATATQPATR